MPNPYRITALVAISALSLGAISMMSPRVPDPDPQSAPTLGPLYAAPVERVETHVLGTGQTLSGVLAQASITGQEMADLLLGIREHLNPRRLTDRTEVTVRRWLSNDEPRTVDVRVNADSTVRLVKTELGWESSLVMTPTVLDTVFAVGAIDGGRTSLYEAIVFDEQSTLPIPDRRGLVYALASIYEFKLDFTREIQPGDSYRFVYERESRPDGTSRAQRIIAAEIVTRGKAFPAFWFDGNADVHGYFDDEARPLKSGFSKYPVEFARVTSAFNPRRYHPILGVYRAHAGTDFGGGTGTPVMATANGTVTYAGVNGGYGNLVEIRHMNGYTTRYAHLSRFAKGVRAGTRVSQKQVIGYIGKTGLATAPHLHYELRRNGRAVNAMRADLPTAPPIAGALKNQFLAVAKDRATLLDQVPMRGRFAGAGTASAGKSADEL